MHPSALVMHKIIAIYGCRNEQAITGPIPSVLNFWRVYYDLCDMHLHSNELDGEALLNVWWEIHGGIIAI